MKVSAAAIGRLLEESATRPGTLAFGLQLAEQRTVANLGALACGGPCPLRLHPIHRLGEGDDRLLLQCVQRPSGAVSGRKRGLSEVYACLGCSAQCGRCAHAIKRIMDEGPTCAPGSVHASMH
jgi:bacterioferritin-associated ferredoxin